MRACADCLFLRTSRRVFSSDILTGIALIFLKEYLKKKKNSSAGVEGEINIQTTAQKEPRESKCANGFQDTKHLVTPCDFVLCTKLAGKGLRFLWSNLAKQQTFEKSLKKKKDQTFQRYYFFFFFEGLVFWFIARLYKTMKKTQQVHSEHYWLKHWLQTHVCTHTCGMY